MASPFGDDFVLLSNRSDAQVECAFDLEQIRTALIDSAGPPTPIVSNNRRASHFVGLTEEQSVLTSAPDVEEAARIVRQHLDKRAAEMSRPVARKPAPAPRQDSGDSVLANTPGAPVDDVVGKASQGEHDVSWLDWLAGDPSKPQGKPHGAHAPAAGDEQWLNVYYTDP